MHAIGVLADRQDLIDEAIDYFKNGGGMGAIENTIWKIHNEEGTNKPLGQNQEAGRDQGHSTLVFAHLAALAQQSYNQGEDLFAYLDNRILAGSVQLTDCCSVLFGLPFAYLIYLPPSGGIEKSRKLTIADPIP